jgi:Tc5 transposase DNA-binding domain.
MEDRLLKWFCHAQNYSLAVDTVEVKADEIALKMCINFKCSNGWLQHFKERHNITCHSVSGGAAADLDLVPKWQENVKPIVTQHVPKDIFNLDETAVFYNVQKRRTLNMKRTDVPGRERV